MDLQYNTHFTHVLAFARNLFITRLGIIFFDLASDIEPCCTSKLLILRSDLVHTAGVWRSPPRSIAFRTAGPVPWADCDNSWVRFGPRVEVQSILCTHTVIAVVITDVSSIWVVIHMGPVRPWHEHHLLGVREIRVDVPLVPWLHCCLRPPGYWAVHVVQIDAEPIDCLWDGKVGDRFFLCVVPSVIRATEKSCLVGPDNCRAPRERCTDSARIFDIVLSHHSSPSKRGSLSHSTPCRVICGCIRCTYRWSHSAPHQLITKPEPDNGLVGKKALHLWHYRLPLQIEPRDSSAGALAWHRTELG